MARGKDRQIGHRRTVIHSWNVWNALDDVAESPRLDLGLPVKPVGAANGAAFMREKYMEEGKIDSHQAPPWLTIWIHPRDTIDRILNSDSPEQFAVLLAMLWGLAVGLTTPGRLTDIMPLAGPFVAVGGLYIWGFLCHWTGWWLGGQAEMRDIRAAFAWACVPLVWGLLLFIPARIGFGNATREMVLVRNILALWSSVLFVQCVGEAHGFSGWKALGAVLLATPIATLLSIILGVIGIFVALLIGRPLGVHLR